MSRKSEAATWILVLSLAVAALAGCSAKKEPAPQQEQASRETPEPAVSTNQPPPGMTQEQIDNKQPEPVREIETPRREEEKPKPAPKPKAPPAPAEVSVKAGTVFNAKLDQELSSHESKAGDAFTLKVTQPVIIAGYVAIPAGATVNGVVVAAKASGKASGRGDITLAFKSVTDALGKTHDIDAETFYGQAEGSGDRDAAVIAGGAGAGAIIGGIVGGGKGALIGGLIGGAAGTGTVLATSGPQVKITPGSEFGIKLNAGLLLPAGSKVEG
jgi:hypothetical protein